MLAPIPGIVAASYTCSSFWKVAGKSRLGLTLHASISGAGERPVVKSTATLVEDPGLILRGHMEITTIYNSGPRDNILL